MRTFKLQGSTIAIEDYRVLGNAALIGCGIHADAHKI